MKVLHRGKAIECYKAARMAEEEGQSYATYVMLKESLRATLAYIGEDVFKRDYSVKTSLKTLMVDTPVKIADNYDMSAFDIILDLERQGLKVIMSTEVEEFKRARVKLKKIIGLYLNERL